MPHNVGLNVISTLDNTPDEYFHATLDAQILEVNPKPPAEFRDMRIDCASHFNFYSGDINPLQSSLKQWFLSLGNNLDRSTKLTKWVIDFRQNILVNTGQESAWLCLRATKPNSAFQIPRWHQDGMYFDLDRLKQGLPTNPQYKVVFTPKGPPTLFANPTDVQRKIIGDLKAARNFLLGNLKNPTERQRELASTLRLLASEDTHPSHPFLRYEKGFRQMLCELTGLKNLDIPNDCAVRYRVGQDYNAVYHSEPNMISDRLFLQILPGTQAQINELGQRFGQSRANLNVERA